MSDTIADTIASIGHLLGQGFPLPHHIFQKCSKGNATLWILHSLPHWIYNMFLLVQDFEHLLVYVRSLNLPSTPRIYLPTIVLGSLIG